LAFALWGCASRSLCRFTALELRSHPAPMVLNSLREFMAEGAGFEPAVGMYNTQVTENQYMMSSGNHMGNH